jgi:hypothetical protein
MGENALPLSFPAFFFKTAATNPPGGAWSLNFFFTTPYTPLFFLRPETAPHAQPYNACFVLGIGNTVERELRACSSLFYLRRQKKNKTKSKGLEKGAPIQKQNLKTCRSRSNVSLTASRGHDKVSPKKTHTRHLSLSLSLLSLSLAVFGKGRARRV